MEKSKQQEALIEALNSLITINNDRFEGYTRASEETKDGDLKQHFYASANKSKGYGAKLSQYVKELQGEPAEGTTNSGKLYRIWMDVKAALAIKDRKAILSACEFGEDAALKVYTEIRENADLNMPPDYMATIKMQESEIMHDHNIIKQMRDMAKV